MSKPCLIPSCDNLVSDNSQTGECHACRATYHRWRKRRPQDILDRMRALRKYGERMDNLSEQPVSKRHVNAVREGKRDVRQWTRN